MKTKIQKKEPKKDWEREFTKNDAIIKGAIKGAMIKEAIASCNLDKEQTYTFEPIQNSSVSYRQKDKSIKKESGPLEMEEVSPLIKLHDVEIDNYPIVPGMKKIFASYSLMDLLTGQMGFGNTCAVFNQDLYNPNNIEQFIAHLQKSIAMAVEAKTGQRHTIKESDRQSWWLRT